MQPISDWIACSSSLSRSRTIAITNFPAGALSARSS
jgi:hypothetical protein